MVIYLRYKSDKVVDRAEYLRTYEANIGYKMLNGAPLLVNVDGSYIKASDIPDLLVSRKYAKQVNDWLQELKQPIEDGGIILEFVWRR